MDFPESYTVNGIQSEHLSNGGQQEDESTHNSTTEVSAQLHVWVTAQRPSQPCSYIPLLHADYIRLCGTPF